MDLSDKTQRTEIKGQEGSSIFFRAVGFAKACYLVSSVIKDSEPLKGQIRKVSNKLIEDMSEFAYVQKSAGASQPLLLSAREKFSELVIFLNLAFITQLISKMNYEILKAEGDKILVQFDIILGDYVKVGMLSSDFFAGGQKRDDRESLLLPTATTQQVNVPGLQPARADQRVLGIRQTSAPLKDKNGEDAGNSKTSSNRRERILSFMKGKQKLSVGDVANFIKDCSEKTIQRELVDLVEKGLVTKEGERRWSRYTLVS